jgi:hypothetical protein
MALVELGDVLIGKVVLFVHFWRFLLDHLGHPLQGRLIPDQQ